MANLLKSLFGGSGIERSERQYQGVGANAALLAFLDKTIGQPFSISELWTLSPTSRSIFRGADTPAGAFTLQHPDSPMSQPPPAQGTQGPVKFSMADVTAAYQMDPEKLMDVQRLFKGSGVDPNSFTLDEFTKLAAGAGWASGRSKGNFTRVISELTNRGQVYGAYQTNRFAPVAPTAPPPSLPELTKPDTEEDTTTQTPVDLPMPSLNSPLQMPLLKFA